MAVNAKAKFLGLVAKVGSDSTGRSENDLSANLANYLASLQLFPVVDTAGGSGGRKRPDIRAYVSAANADLVLPAEIVIESKKPGEVKAYPNLRTAMVADDIWYDKTFPYLKENIERIRYFALTTFVSFAVVEIDESLRKRLAVASLGDKDDRTLRKTLFDSAIEFVLTNDLPASDPKSAEAWDSWCRNHIVPDKLKRLRFSDILNLSRVATSQALESFAGRLANIAAGAADDRLRDAGLFHSIRRNLADDYDGLSADVRRDLQIFLMTQHPGADLSAAEAEARTNLSASLDEFVAASIHSLIGRLFAYKSIEDAFCVGVDPPLIETKLWLFNSKRYDSLSDDRLLEAFAVALGALKAAHNPAIKRLATNGVFYDWILVRIDAALFRDLAELFAGHDFSELEGDLLGRFFELYAQDVNRTKRRALGQYYTPQPIVAAMWTLALDLVKQRGALADLQVLDPGAGSGTFLVEGARALERAGQAKFWEQLTGFDISIQAVGIAYVNVYLAVLGLLSREHADDVTDLAVFATDALDPRNGKYLKSILPLVTDEDYKRLIEQRVQLSEQIKKEGRFNLIIGNPPYRNNSSRTLAQVAEIFPRLLATSRAHARAQERNARDDYAWFIAASDFYVGQKGIIAFIVSDSFCHLFSYKDFRGDLLRHYHVRTLIRLGGTVFQDVGPRISFVIVVLEKRAAVLDAPDQSSEIPYVDLRALAADASPDLLATIQDPRLLLLQRISENLGALPTAATHRPTLESGYGFYPVGEIQDRVKSGSVPVFEKKKDRIFLEKWPGIITAFDDLLKSDDAETLRTRMSSFFTLAGRRSLLGSKLDRELAGWGGENGIGDAQLDRLRSLVDQIRGSKIAFNAAKIKRALDGSAPNSYRWYPTRHNRVYVYYEPSFRFSRNENEGKAVGWGDMQQWRERTSHDIRPKLIFTTGTKANYGLKAFVVHDEWYVKLHGGTSQQYHYTGIEDASRNMRTDGVPNNLTDKGSQIADALASQGLAPEALLFYIAGIYNSDLAAEYLLQQGDSKLFGIKIPANKKQASLAAEISSLGQRIRNLHWVAELLEDAGTLDPEFIDKVFQPGVIKKIGFVQSAPSGGRFKKAGLYHLTEGGRSRISEITADMQAALEARVGDLYG